MKYKIEKNTVQETLIIPLYARKVCSELYPNLYQDETAVRLINEIDYDFSEAEKNSRSLMQRFGSLEVAMRQNDLAFEVRDYLKSHPNAAVVNLGCGLDSTGRSCDNGSFKIDNHIVPELGNTPLEKLTTIQIQKFYNDLQKSGRIQRYTHIKLKDKGLSTRVVRGIHTLLNNCLEQAVAERLLLANPAKGCRLPKLEKREMKILPEDKIGPYLAEAERRGLLAAFYLELTTGLRRGELLALLWTDLDVENMTISVSKQVNRINGELVVSQPKTPNSIRKLAIPQRAVELLVEEHAKHPHSPYLFVSPKTGTMFDPDSFRHTHEKILKAIGAEHIRFHDLRHTFATLSLKYGVDVKTLSGALGHYDAGFTLSTYTHATEGMKRSAADTIGSVISQTM